MPRLEATPALAVFLNVFAASACKSANGPDAVAAEFVDRYYVEFELDRAKALTVGAARERIDRESALVKEARQRVQVEGQKARVYYGAPERRQVRDDLVHYTYTLDIRPAGAAIQRPVVVMVGHRPEGWRVVGFRESGGGTGLENGSTSTAAEP